MLNVGRQSFVLVVLEAFQYFCVYEILCHLCLVVAE